MSQKENNPKPGTQMIDIAKKNIKAFYLPWRSQNQ